MLESVWTAPHADCPRPERWHCDDGESTEREVTVLVAAFVTALQPDTVVETGTGFGQTAEAIGRALQGNGHGRLVTFETDPERHRHAQARCAGLPVNVLNVSSVEWAPYGPIDFMWLDSLPNLRPLEVRRYAPFAGAQCVIGVHDTATHDGLVRRPLDELVAEGLLQPPLYLPTPRGVCFTRLQGRD